MTFSLSLMAEALTLSDMRHNALRRIAARTEMMRCAAPSHFKNDAITPP